MKDEKMRNAGFGTRNRSLSVLFIVAAAISGTGCKTVQVKPSGRPASDQFLVARTMADAIRQMDVRSELKGTSVTVTLSGLGIDAEYFNRVLEAWLTTANGATVVKSGDLTLHMMIEAAGSDTHESKWELPIPLPSLQLGITLTHFVIMRNTVQFSRCHLWAYATNKANKTVFVQPPVYATHYLSNRELLGFTLGSWSDLIELRKRQGRKIEALPISKEAGPSKFSPADLISDGLF